MEMFEINYVKENALKYKKSEVKEGTFYLGYRDIPFLLSRYASGKRAIDYGCGTGRSTRFLQMLGYETIGVDISKDMLEQANAIDKSSHYLLIENAKIPVLDNSCDVIFAGFVVCTIPTLEELSALYKEVYRCLKRGGIFIATTAADQFYAGKWLSYNVSFPQNKHLKPGDPAKLYLKDLDVKLINYYWTHKEYCKISEDASLKIVDRLLPLGDAADQIEWVSEADVSPYAIYVLQKPLE